MSQPTRNQLIEEQKVRAFFLAALTDEVLLSKLIVAMDTNNLAAFSDLAATHGYDLSQDSLNQGLKSIANLIVAHHLK